MEAKRPHSPGDGSSSAKKPKGPPPPGGYFAGPPGWGAIPPPPFPGYAGYYPPPPDDFELYGSHRDEWYPGAAPPPPPPIPPPPSKPAKEEDFSDDTFAIYGDGQDSGGGSGRGANLGRGRGFRGGGNFWRGRGGFQNPNQNRGTFRGRGRGFQGRGGPAKRGNQGGGADRGGTAGGARGRGRGQVQKGMPPNVFSNRGAKKAKTGTVPPVHSLAKVGIDVTNMSAAEKIHRFSLYVRSDPLKDNAIQHLVNAQTGSKLMIQIDYESEELAKVGSKHMYTGRLKLAGVFLARAVSVNKKELKHLVFQKALNILLTKTVAEIYSLVDPGVETLRKELEKEEEAENQKKDTRNRDWMGQDIGEAFQLMIDKLKNKFPSVYSDISRIEHAIAACQCVIRHQFLLDAVKHKNGRVNYKGSLMINNIVIARGSAVSKKNCKRITYTNALERLLKEPIQELLKPVAEDDESESDEEEPDISKKKDKPSKAGMIVKVVKMSKKERFTELLSSLKTQAFKENNINPIDVTAMQFGITPMVVYRKLDSKRDQEDNLSCELYLDKIFIASADGRKRNPAQKETYSKAWEFLTTTDVDTILTQHPVIDDEALEAPDVADILVKGGGKRSESNLAALRRSGRPDRDPSLKKEDLVIVEHSDWSNDRIRNSFCILQCSCSQNGMLLKWTTEGNNSKYKCEIFVQEDLVGGACGTSKQAARNLAMSDALFKLYETQDVVRISRRDDSKSWIPWQKIMDEAERLKRKSSPVEEPESGKDEKGYLLPNQFIVKVVSRRLEDFAESGDIDEVIIGPGMPATEGREIRYKARELHIMVDVRQHMGESYTIFYKKLNYLDLVKLLKKRKKPYGKYELVPKDELPKHADVESLVKKIHFSKEEMGLMEEEMLVDD